MHICASVCVYGGREVKRETQGLLGDTRVARGQGHWMTHLPLLLHPEPSSCTLRQAETGCLSERVKRRNAWSQHGTKAKEHTYLSIGLHTAVGWKPLRKPFTFSNQGQQRILTIKANNPTLHSKIGLIKQPYLDFLFALQETEDEINGLGHDFLDLRRHFCRLRC